MHPLLKVLQCVPSAFGIKCRHHTVAYQVLCHLVFVHLSTPLQTLSLFHLSSNHMGLLSVLEQDNLFWVTCLGSCHHVKSYPMDWCMADLLQRGGLSSNVTSWGHSPPIWWTVAFPNPVTLHHSTYYHLKLFIGYVVLLLLVSSHKQLDSIEAGILPLSCVHQLLEGYLAYTRHSKSMCEINE